MVMTSSQKRRRSSVAVAEPKPFVERLLICFPELPKRCNCTIDESSSLLELTENILYFHDVSLSSSMSSSSSPSDTGSTSSEEAFQFFGLCSAMLSFPSMLNGGDNHNGNDHTEEVHFANSTLVFFPIEGAEIYAFVQVPRGTSPLAIRKSIQQSHGMFCLLRRGGILARLVCKYQLPLCCDDGSGQSSFSYSILNLSFKEGDDVMPPDISDTHHGTELSLDEKHVMDDEKTDSIEQWINDGCVYIGMKSVYQLRKQIRKLNHAIAKIPDLLELKRANMEEELQEKLHQLDELYSIIPISSIRKDLKNHYDEYLTEPSHSSRCLVEAIPRPIKETTANLDNSDDGVEKSVLEVLKKAFLSRAMDDPLLIAITSFRDGTLLHTKTLRHLDTEAQNVIEMTKVTSYQIMRYMMSFEERSRPRHRVSLRLFQQNVQDSLQRLSLQGLAPAESKVHGRFLSSPPLSMLNISDELSEVRVEPFGNVWTPIFYISVDDQNIMAHVALYSIREYTFLIYLDTGTLDLSPDLLQMSTSSFTNYFEDENDEPIPSEGKNEIRNPVANLLHNASIHLSNHVIKQSENEVSMCEKENEDGCAENGFDIIFVNRDEGDVMIQLGKASRGGGRGRGGGSGRAGGGGGDSMGETDLRHRLLSRLSESYLNSLDDIMSEINDAATTTSDRSNLDICTYVPPGWIWASSRGSKELYLLFDDTVHATVVDVHEIAERIRPKFM